MNFNVKKINVCIIICIAILSIISVLGIFSAGYNSNYSQSEYIKQIIWIVVGIISIFLIYFIDYHTISKLGYVLYFLTLILLILVLFTTPINNARSWFDFKFFKLQPAELMKIAYILVFANVLNYYLNHKDEIKNKIAIIFIAFGVFVIPIILVFLQPDLGTTLVFFSITFFMLFKARIKYRYIIVGVLLILLMIPIVYFGVLSNYQKERILVFMEPERDPLGSGYNAIQSEIAIGSGRLFGNGILKGTQTQYGYLPVKSSDFIFSVISEEMGFVISGAIVIIYIILFLQIIKIAFKTEDNLGGLIVMGIFGMMFFHFIENIGMTMGLLPITGIPLPFLSYGGSSTLVNFIAIGIVLSINHKFKKHLF